MKTLQEVEIDDNVVEARLAEVNLVMERLGFAKTNNIYQNENFRNAGRFVEGLMMLETLISEVYERGFTAGQRDIRETVADMLGLHFM